jgi:hypothetical protein
VLWAFGKAAAASSLLPAAFVGLPLPLLAETSLYGFSFGLVCLVIAMFDALASSS